MVNKPAIQYVQYYTAGSAARQVNILHSNDNVILPKPKKHKRKVLFVDPVAILGIVVAVSMLVMMVVGIVEFSNERQHTEMLENYVEVLSQENVELSTQYRAGIDLDEVERTALALGMVPAQQVSHVSITVGSEQTQQSASLWEQIQTFLTGLFA